VQRHDVIIIRAYGNKQGRMVQDYMDNIVHSNPIVCLGFGMNQVRCSPENSTVTLVLLLLSPSYSAY
jgi:hypothetical protein